MGIVPPTTSSSARLLARIRWAASRLSPRLRRRARVPWCKWSRNMPHPWRSHSPSNELTAAHIVRHVPSWSIYRHVPRTPLMWGQFSNRPDTYFPTAGCNRPRYTTAHIQTVGAVREPPKYVSSLRAGTPDTPGDRGRASPPRPHGARALFTNLSGVGVDVEGGYVYRLEVVGFDVPQEG